VQQTFVSEKQVRELPLEVTGGILGADTAFLHLSGQQYYFWYGDQPAAAPMHSVFPCERRQPWHEHPLDALGTQRAQNGCIGAAAAGRRTRSNTAVQKDEGSGVRPENSAVTSRRQFTHCFSLTKVCCTGLSA